MPRQKKPWFRVYVEMVRDPKLNRLTPPQRWLWVVILACARESPEPGFLMLSETVAMTAADLAALAGVSKDVAAKGIAVMVELGMLEAEATGGWSVPSWWDRQWESDARPNHHVGTT